MWLSIATDRPVERAVEQYNSFTRQLSSSFFYFFSVSEFIHSFGEANVPRKQFHFGRRVCGSMCGMRILFLPYYGSRVFDCRSNALFTDF